MRDFVNEITQIKVNQGISNASVNRLLALLRSIIRKAHFDWEWIDRILKVRLLPEPKRLIHWITSNGTPLNVLQELGGWESVEMVRRYAHLGNTHLASYSENSCQL